jgi:hypothetical protein
MGSKLRIHLVECVIGDAEGGEHLPSGSFTLTHFIDASPRKTSPNHGCEHQASRQAQPHHGMGL